MTASTLTRDPIAASPARDAATRANDDVKESTGPHGSERPVRPAVPAERGRTSIADPVVGKIAGMAAREVPGVYAFGGGLSRTLGAVRDRVPGSRPNLTRGVKVEVGERQTAVDLEIVVEYGVAIVEVAVDVRENVVAAIERMTGLEVVEVNISVVDVHLPGDDEEDEPDTRVR